MEANVAGSAKVRPLVFGAVAHLGERLHGMEEVAGSIPVGSTRELHHTWKRCAFGYAPAS